MNLRKASSRDALQLLALCLKFREDPETLAVNDKRIRAPKEKKKLTLANIKLIILQDLEKKEERGRRGL